MNFAILITSVIVIALKSSPGGKGTGDKSQGVIISRAGAVPNKIFPT
jgi:hypothetical protein